MQICVFYHEINKHLKRPEQNLTLTEVKSLERKRVKSNPNAFTFTAAMSIRISSFASVKNERMEEDDDDISYLPNPNEFAPPPPR